MGKTLLDGGNTLILCFENFNCLLLAFFRVHQKLQLWLNILTTKWYIFVQNKVALIIKSSKDSKNGAKCYHRPLHHSFLSNPLKKLWHRYFNIGASKFFEMYLKFIFSVSPFMWIWNQSWKLTSLCTGLCAWMDAQAPNKVPFAFVTHATLIMRARSEGGREGGKSENTTCPDEPDMR